MTAKLALPEPDDQTNRNPDDQQQQQSSDNHIENQQLPIGFFILGTVVGGNRQQEQQGDTNQDHADSPQPQDPARRPRLRDDLSQTGQKSASAHLPASVNRRTLFTADIVQSLLPINPIWNGRGS